MIVEIRESPASRDDLTRIVENAVVNTSVADVHTHLFAPAFGDLVLYGIDELLIYHYNVAEAFRRLDWPYEKFWALCKTEQADLIWDALFMRHSPISEACRGVLTTLNLLGLDANRRDLPALRQWFARWKPAEYVAHCMELAKVDTICMTNSPFDDAERAVWDAGFAGDARFATGLRIDPILVDWETTMPRLIRWGYEVSLDLGGKTFAEVRRFLADWSQRMNPHYVMVSLPPHFAFPGDNVPARLIEGAVLPYCREWGQPFALMMGVKRGVNPGLQMAGDGLGRSDLGALQNLCAAYPDNKFLATVLPRENQHELCVLARKFRNLHIFGCWWFVNVPSLVEEITTMRIEMLGTSFTAQHSDARVIDQILYKWQHSRQIIARVLSRKYLDLAATGWMPTRAEVERDVQEILGGGFRSFLKS
ncbi:MAG TPA: hypothetical protein VNA16_01555 [Abditibacteriaceae bacterium]|nr:hypothetical protein [Abditibacteriaceae bacterium]